MKKKRKAESGKRKKGSGGHRFPRSAFRFRPSSGFTLLEVLLGLFLATVVLVLVAMAVDMFLRLLDSNRTDVEQAQLARAVLKQMGDDLHNVVPYSAQDASSGSVTAASSATATASSSGAMSSSGSSSTPMVSSGLYGSTQQLQFDFTRVTKPTLSNSSTADPSLVTPVGDVRTVTYVLAGGDSSGVTGSEGQGLIRYELDRAAALQSTSTGQYSDDLSNQQPIAPEVTDLQFSYFDGVQWNDQWDSSAQSGLPLAVQVVVSFSGTQTGGAQSGSSSDGSSPSDDTSSQRTYRMTYPLPAAVLAGSGAMTSSSSGSTGAPTQ
jgi:type II secretory pathway component PulJ